MEDFSRRTAEVSADEHVSIFIIWLIIGGLISVAICMDGDVSVSGNAPGYFGPDGTGRANGRRTVSVPDSIASDCSEEVAGELTSFFEKVGDGTTVTFPEDGCFLVNDGKVQVKGKTGLSIEGNNAVFKRDRLLDRQLRYPARTSFLQLVDLTESIVRNVRVSGTNVNDGSLPDSVKDKRGDDRSIGCVDHYDPADDWGCYSVAFEFEHGIGVVAPDGVTLENISTNGTWGDGIYVTGRDQFSDREDNDEIGGVTIRNVSIERNGRQGIGIAQMKNVLIDGAEILHSRRSGVDLEPNTSSNYVRNVEIRNSTIHSHLLAFASYGKGDVSDVYIHDNNMTKTGVPWVYVRAGDGTARHRWRIEDNVVSYPLGSPQPGMLFDNVHDVTVKRNENHYAAGRGMDAVGLLGGCSGVEVTCNWFEHARRPVAERDDSDSKWSESRNTTGSEPLECLDP